MTPRIIILAAALAAPLGVAACGGTTDDTTAAAADAPARVEVVSPDEAAATIADPPPGLVVLDVRTPDEFAAGHLAGATLLDFYEPTFADELAELDRDVPYLIYCRSGNRSGQTRALMADLGFQSVEDLDGGVLAWSGAGMELTRG